MHRCGWFGGVAAYFIGSGWCVCVCARARARARVCVRAWCTFGNETHSEQCTTTIILTDYFNN